jgi:hypothetical protein
MMSKRPTVLEKAIASLDEKIAALQLARAHLLEQQAEARDAIAKVRAEPARTRHADVEN